MATVYCMQVVFSLCYLVFITAVTSLLDLEELKNVHYEIDISDKPVLIGRPIEQEVMYLASKYGQRYECQLPDMSDYEKEQEEEKVAGEVGISELLKPMETAPCVVKTKDWWTYEFCYGRHIKQYHLEGSTQEDITFLGHYESEMDWSNKARKDAKRHRLNRYHSHKYNNGTECDITGKPRESEVRFVCAEGQGDSIDRIDEPSSCVYILTIHTTRICHHPFLRPPPSLKPKSVLCFPALEQDQYNQYTLVQEEKVKAKIEALEKLQSKMKLINKISIVNSDDGQDDDSEADKADGDEEEEKDSESENQPPGHEDEDESTDIEEQLANLGIDLHGVENVVAKEADPNTVQKILEAVLRSVKESVQSIEDEVEGDSDTIKSIETEAKSNRDEDQDEDQDEDDEKTKQDEYLDLDNDDDEVEDLTDTDLDTYMLYMEKDYAELLQEFRESIGETTDDPAEVARLNALAEQLESSFENIETMEEVLRKVDISQLDPKGAPDDSGTKKLVKMLTTLIREVLNGRNLKEYMKTYGLYLSTFLKDFRETIDDMTDDPEEIKRLNALADELEMTIKELEENEEDAEKKEVTQVLEESDTAKQFVNTLKKAIKAATDIDKSGKSVVAKPRFPTTKDNNGQVSVRVTRIKLDKGNPKIDLNEAEESQIFDSNHRRIEDTVKQHLENAGVKVEGGGKIEFRILTYTPGDWPEGEDGSDLTILSEDESLYFKNMIVGLLGANAEENEQSRQSRLENNYHFMWDEQGEASSHQTTEVEDVQEVETV